MKGALIEDYSNPVLRSLARSALSSFLLENKRIPFYVAFDASTIHFKHWVNIVFNPKAKTAWRKILEKYYETDEYKKLNEAVHGDEFLSKYATISFLNRLFKVAEKKSRELRLASKQCQSCQLDPVEALDGTLASRPDIATQMVTEIVNELREEAREVLADIEAIESFSHFDVPIARLLEKPDEFREVSRNRIVVHLVRFLNKLRREAPSLKHTRAPTLVGGRPLGVKRLQRWSELPRALPFEFLDDGLLTYKIASRTLRVSEQYGSIPNYVVYLDKSGSMAGNIKYYTSPASYEHVPKISFATASAIALAWALKKYGAKMILKLFDVDVHDPITDFSQLISVLARIRADSGTDITRVLEDALQYRDEKIIVITDGIDQVSEEAVKKAKSAGLDITFVFINTDNELLRKNFPHIHIREARPTILLEI